MKLIKTTMTGYEFIIDYLDPVTREVKYEVLQDGENGYWKETEGGLDDQSSGFVETSHYKFKNGQEVWEIRSAFKTHTIKDSKGFEITQNILEGEYMISTHGLERRAEYNLRKAKLSEERRKSQKDGEEESVKIFTPDIEELVDIEPFTFDW